ncbi:MAG: DNA mismatch endonuclease Vsr [Acidobacteria bacterium]|nr:DNA mismatch endonuclease Vsr [Acidobacteriota bacterium]
MTDVLTPEQRSRCMAAIRGKHTKPEVAVRRLLREFGIKHSLHSRTLPGKPDIVLRNRKMAIFVHGCFWHVHRCRYGRVKPATNAEFWQNKRIGNVKRDRRHVRALRKAGWKVFTVWECWTRRPEVLLGKLSAVLKPELGVSSASQSQMVSGGRVSSQS